MKSSEEVLSLIRHVRHKKVDGQLYLMSERLAWGMEKSQTFSVSYKYSEIKTQKISPEGKVKIQLQIVLYNGETFNFHFNSPEGIDQQLKDRHKVKELLQQLLPQFRRQMDSQLEEKNLLLQKYPELFTLYKELVVTQIITPEEFWENYAQKYQNQLKPKSSEHNDTPLINDYQTSCNDQIQSIGISGSYLSDLTPQSDGANGIKYNLTSDIIDSIFRIYPSVKKKHEENVPHNMSEIEFWTKFFQSHYFHREKNLSLQSSHSKDYFFSECVKTDANIIKEQIERGEPNPLLDLERMADETDYSEPIFDVYGDVNSQNLTLIQRFNQHSILLNQATLPKRRRHLRYETLESSDEPNAELPNKINRTTGMDDASFSNKENVQILLHDKLQQEYEDLITPTTNYFSSTSSNTPAYNDPNQHSTNAPTESADKNRFRLCRPEDFLNGPGGFVGATSSNLDPNQAAVSLIHEFIGDSINLKNSYSLINDSLHKLTNESTLDENLLSEYSSIVLNDLSPGGKLMKNVASFGNDDLSDMLPDQLINDVKRAYIALNELLRHFYACFPVTTPALESKLEKMKTSLTNFYAIRIKGIDENVKKTNHPNYKVTEHMSYMIRSALEKYSAWMRRKQQNLSAVPRGAV